VILDIPFAEISGFPVLRVPGHSGRFLLGYLSKVPVVVLNGRSHFYEGHSMASLTFPVRVLKEFGVRDLVLTNAAGGINLNYGQGRLVVIKDHINFQGQNPLVGQEDPNLGLRFIDMSEAYSRDYRRMAVEAGKRLGRESASPETASVLRGAPETLPPCPKASKPLGKNFLSPAWSCLGTMEHDKGGPIEGDTTTLEPCKLEGSLL